MNKDQLNMMWDHLRQAHGITLRVIAAIPADKIDATPIPKMRTTKEMVTHTYAMVVREIVEGVARGKINELDEKSIVAGIKNQADLLNFATTQWNAASAVVAKLTDADLMKTIETPWNFSAPGFVMLNIINDEYFHHRGQLYAYVRAFGAEPPMMWDFEHNAPEYRPNMQTQS